MQFLSGAGADSGAENQTVSLIVTLFVAALATIVFTVLARRLDLKHNWLAAAFVFCMYAAGLILLRFDQSAALGFITGVAAVMALLTGVLMLGQLIFLVWSPRLNEISFVVFSGVCCASNLTLAVKTFRDFLRWKRADARVQPQYFVTGFMVPFSLLWMLPRMVIYLWRVW